MLAQIERIVTINTFRRSRPRWSPDRERLTTGHRDDTLACVICRSIAVPRSSEDYTLMKQFYDSYFDMYWDLHLGVRGDAIPAEVREFGSSFTTFLGYWYPTSEVVHEHYMRARRTRQPLKEWVDARVQDMIDGKVSNADQTLSTTGSRTADWGELSKEGHRLRML